MSGGALQLDLDMDKMLLDIQRRLGDMKSDAPKVLAQAVNAAARSVRKQIVKDAKGEYALSGKAKAMLSATKALQLKTAKKSNMEATLTSKGAMNELMDFVVSPNSLAVWKDRPAGLQGQVKKKSSPKPLQIGSIKAFITRFSSGHIAVVERVPGKYMAPNVGKYGNTRKQALKKLLSPSVPHMLRNPDIQENARTLVGQELPGYVEKYIAKKLEAKK